jgi:hypothetical protein
VLIGRPRRIITGDRKTMILLSVQAPIFGVIIALLYPAQTLSTNSGPFAALLLWLLVISATWLGASGTIREIVKELAIYRRERAVGLSILAYVGSKFAVFGAITVVQAFVVALIGLSRQNLPPIDSQNFIVLLHQFRPALFRGLRPFAVGSVLSSQQLEVLIAVALSGLAGTGLGLAISALVRKSDQAVFLLPVVLVIEMALSLPLLKLDNSSPFIQVGSKIVSAGWGLSALGSTVSLNQLLTPYRWALTFGERDVAYNLHALQAQVNHRPLPPVPPIPIRQLNQALKTDPSWAHSSSAWLTAMLVLIIMTAVLLAIAVVALRRLDIGRQGRKQARAR